MPESRSTNPQIPRYWITLGKEIIFDVPRDLEFKDKFRLHEHIPAISDLIREYINSPIEGLVEKKFDDIFGITDILKAADRRIGKRQLARLPQRPAVKKIIESRLG
jgi:hypothetical protein